MIKNSIIPLLIATISYIPFAKADESTQDYVITKTVETSSLTEQGLYVSSKGNLTLKGDSTITNHIIVDGGSLTLALPENDDDDDDSTQTATSTLTQTNADDEQALTIRNSGTVTLEGSENSTTTATIAGKADLVDGTLNVNSGSSLTIGKDYTSDNSKLDADGSVSISGDATLTNSSALSGTVSIGGNLTASDSTIDAGINTITVTGTGSITGGTVTASASTDSVGSITFNDKMTISDSTINLQGDEENEQEAVLKATDISSTDTDISLSTARIYATDGNIVLDNSNVEADHGGLTATGTIDLKNGTYTFYGNATALSATQTNVASDATLNLDAGSVVSGILNVNGNVSLLETETGDLNVSGASGNGNIDMKWNNFIDGDFNLTENATMTMTQSADHTSILSITNGDMNVTNSSVDMDIGAIKNEDGAVNFNDNSALSLRIAGKPTDEKDTYGHIEANEINISGNNTSLNIILDTGVLTKEEGQIDFTLLDADSVDGQFSELVKNNRYTIVYKGDGVFGITEKTSAGGVVTEDDYDIRDMADAWLSEAFPSDSPGKEVQDMLNTLSQTPGMEQAFTDTLNALSPDTTPIVTTLSATFNRQMANVIGARLEKMRAQSKYRYKRYTYNQQPIFEKQDGLWIQGLTNKIDYTDSKGFDAKNNGVAVGADIELVDGFKIGLGYSYTDTDANSIGRDTDVSTHLGAVYIDMNGDEFYFNTLATYGRSQYEEKKDVYSIPVKAKYDVDFWGVQSILGYDPGAMRIGKYGMGTIMPEIGVRYMAVKKKEYTDSADQRVKDADADTLTGTLGAHYTLNYDFGNVIFYPDLKAAVTYDFIQDELESVVVLPNDLAYRVKEERLDKLGVEVGAELGVKIAKTVDISLSYLGMFRKDYKDHTGFLNLKYHF